MNLKPIICKHCSKTIKPSPLIIGESEPVRMGKTVQNMAKHIEKMAQEEQGAGIASANGKPFKAGPHIAAVIRLQQAVQGITELSIASNFNLSEDLEAAVNAGRQVLHQETREVRMTDDDLAALYYPARNLVPKNLDAEAAFEAMQDLRDRYEGLGRYAPTSPAQTAPADSARPAVSGTVDKA